MRLGLALALGASFVRGGGGAAPVRPLYWDGEMDFLYLPGGPYWQDTVGGTPAAAGDPCSFQEDLSGRGKHLDFTGGPLPIVGPDGLHLLFAAPSGGIGCHGLPGVTWYQDGWTVYVWSAGPAGAGSNIAFCNASATTSTFLQINASAITYIGTGTGSYVTFADDATVKVRGIAYQLDRGTQKTVGFADATEATNESDGSTTVVCSIGCSNPSFPMTYRFDGAAGFGEYHDSTQRAAFRAWLAGAKDPALEVPTIAAVSMDETHTMHDEGNASLATGGTIAPAVAAWKATHSGRKVTVGYCPSSKDFSTLADTKAGLLTFADEVIVHLHPRDSIVAAAGVTQRLVPSYEGAAVDDTTGGYALALRTRDGGFTKAELIDIFDYCSAQVVALDFPAPTGFVAGGWLTDDTVLEALAASGYTIDASPVPSELIFDEFAAEGYDYLYDEIVFRWPSVTPETLPYVVSTPEGPVTQYPAVFAIADYLTALDMIRLYKRAVRAARARPSHHGKLAWAFHSNALGGLATLTSAFTVIEAHAAAHAVTRVQCTVAEAVA